MRMTRNQIVAVAATRAAERQEITVHTTDAQTFIGTCTFAGTSKFRVDTPLAAVFFTYEEVEAVE